MGMMRIGFAELDGYKREERYIMQIEPSHIKKLLLLAILFVLSPSCFAWGASGHRLISSSGMQSLPDEIPAFLRGADAAYTTGEIGREPDRSRGSGFSHDSDLDPGHYLNLGDTQLIGDSLAMSALPPNRERFDTLLREHGKDEYLVGFLPYSIIDGWQQIKTDFAYWKADVAGIKISSSDEERSWYAKDRQLHEMLILRDIGYWSHFVADASQPMHVSSHHNGWGSADNPGHFTQSASIHADFEGNYVAKFIRQTDVLEKLPQPKDSGCDIERRTIAYLLETNAQIIPLYRLEKQAGFAQESAVASKFVIRRLAAGVAEMRDLIVAAWRCSGESSVGYPRIPLKDIESGKTNPIKEMQGRD